MSDLKVKGTIRTILDKQSGISNAGKEWTKQSFVIANNEGYEGREQLFAFELFGDEKVSKFNNHNNVGKEVEVSFNIKCNEWKDKYFTSLDAWKIFKADTEGKAATEPYGLKPPRQGAPEVTIDAHDNDLPF